LPLHATQFAEHALALHEDGGGVVEATHQSACEAYSENCVHRVVPGEHATSSVW
jgi:hypothetical protein